MKWLSFFTRKSTHGDHHVLEKYKHFRQVGRDLNVALVGHLPKPAVPECGRKIGIYKSGTLILNNDDEIAVLYDYCLYYYRRAGKNVIERYLEQSPPAPGSTEMTLLRGMSKAYFSLFRVEEILPARGAALRDILTGTTVHLTDVGLGDTGIPGLILAGRMIPLPEFTMSSGAMIPVPEPVFEQQIKPVIQTFTKNQPPDRAKLFSPSQEASFAARVLRIALHAGGEDSSLYTDMEP